MDKDATIVSACNKKPNVRNDGTLGSTRKWDTEDPQHDAAAKTGDAAISGTLFTALAWTMTVRSG